jgi:hypothetical protein
MANTTRHFKNCLGVFQGGGCKALAFVGAYQVAWERGVFFSQLAGTSAGSIVAAFIAAGATPEYLRCAIDEADFSAFIEPPDESLVGGRHPLLQLASPLLADKYKHAIRFMSRLGIYSSAAITRWVEGHLRILLKFDEERSVTFADLNIPLHVVATEVGTAGPIIWSHAKTPNESVSYAVRCSCSIPVFFQPVEAKYVDGGVVSNLPTFVLDPEQRLSFEKMLCFTFKAASASLVLRNGRYDPEEYIRRLVSTTIDSGVTIQSSFRDNLHIIEIGDLPLDTVDFDKINSETTKIMIEAGATASRKFFDSETTRLHRDGDTRPALLTEPQTLNQIVRERCGDRDEVVLALKNTRYVYNLFPTLLNWRLSKTKIRFITTRLVNPESKSDQVAHEKLRRLVLRCLGAELHEEGSLPLEGVFFRRLNGLGNAIVFDDKRAEDARANFAVKYDHLEDLAAIDSMLSRLDSIMGSGQTVQCPSITIVGGSLDSVINRLKSLEQYRSRDVSINLEEVAVERIVFLTKYVKSYKYGQIGHLFDVYGERKLHLFEGVEVRYESDELNIMMPVTPPVAEEHGGKIYLVEGNSRLTYLIKEMHMSRVTLLVVRNVSARLPTSGEFKSRQLLISDESKVGTSRYENWTQADYRHIEEAVRRPSLYV